jgi:ketosteroid isomerase-like protein
MDTRQQIDRIIDQVYAARAKQDVEGIVECFCADGGSFHMNGAERPAIARTEQRSSLEGLMATFDLTDFREHCRVIEPPKAVVHWRGKFHSKATGRAAEADILDLIEFKDGKITSLTTFFDTALAGRLTQPG